MPAAESRPSLDLRRARFGALVSRAISDAQDRGMTTTEIEQATKIGNNTWSRWKNGKWSRDPRASEVRSFCVGLGVSLEAAYRALGWAEDFNPQQPEPLDDDEDVRAVMRALKDPRVNPAVKAMMRRQLRALAQEAERLSE